MRVGVDEGDELRLLLQDMDQSNVTGLRESKQYQGLNTELDELRKKFEKGSAPELMEYITLLHQVNDLERMFSLMRGILFGAKFIFTLKTADLDFLFDICGIKIKSKTKKEGNKE